MKVTRIILVIIGYLLITNNSIAQTPATDPHWKLKWQDDFNSFDSNRWTKADTAIHGDEPQLYLKNQVWTSNGNLVIEVNNTKVKCPNPAPETWPCSKCISGKQYNYRSGWIQTTKQADNIQFGYIEARIKLPFRRENNKSWGFFPAFWTFIGDVDGPLPVPQTNKAEIDIFEMFGGEYKEPNTVNTCIHRWDGSSDDHSYNSRSHVLQNFDYRDWHTYALEWNANRMIFYVDGKAIRTLCNHRIIDPVLIILNLAIQGQSKYYPPTSPAFKEYMYVDYVRTYQLKCDKTTVVNDILNFNNYTYAVKKSITLSNATTIPSGSNITLRANDFIQLNPGFEVQTGRELYLDCSPCENNTLISNPHLERGE